MSGQRGMDRARSLADQLGGDTRRRSLHRARRWFAEAAADYDRCAVIPDEIGERLLSRLDCTHLQPTVVLDLGAGTGRALPALRERFPRALLLALDASELMLSRSALSTTWRWWRRALPAVGDAQRLPLADASVDVLFSNLMLPWCADVDAVLRELRRVLRPGGALFVSTLGPGCLLSGGGGGRLDRLAWPLPDVRDLGNLLWAGGFTDPVADVERLTVNYSTRHSLRRDLRALGLPHWGRAFAGDGGICALSVEVIFVHAWRGTSAGLKPGEAALNRLDFKPLGGE